MMGLVKLRLKEIFNSAGENHFTNKMKGKVDDVGMKHNTTQVFDEMSKRNSDNMPSDSPSAK